MVIRRVNVSFVITNDESTGMGKSVGGVYVEELGAVDPQIWNTYALLTNLDPL